MKYDKAAERGFEDGRPPPGGRGLKWRERARSFLSSLSRPPPGGRGLKSSTLYSFPPLCGRPPPGGRGLKLEGGLLLGAGGGVAPRPGGGD